MVAYSFKPSFSGLILTGEKRQTIRAPRGGSGRHARAGDGLQLFTGMRTRACRKLGDATCAEVREVVLDFAQDRVVLDEAIELETGLELNAFAVADGFGSPPTQLSPWGYMRRWWAVTHPGQALFRGVLIGWGESFKPAAAERACRACGCTETNACTVRVAGEQVGCSWASAHLCTACSLPETKIAGPRVSGSVAA